MIISIRNRNILNKNPLLSKESKLICILITRLVLQSLKKYMKICGGVFEQLARYTTRYQESDYIFAFIPLNLLTTSTYSTSPTLLYSNQFKYSSGFNSQSWTCLGQLTGRVSIVFLMANTATGLLLLGNRLAYAQSQLISTKVRRSALTPQTRPSVKTLTSDNAKRITFLIWQQVNS